MARPIPETINIDLGFPYHGRRPAAERLTLIQQFMEDGGYDSEFLCGGALAETLETKIRFHSGNARRALVSLRDDGAGDCGAHSH